MPSDTGGNGSRMSDDSIPIVKSQCAIRLGVALLDDRGERLQTDIQSIEAIIGFEQLLPKVERALLGLRVGERCSMRLQPAEAFGDYDEAKLIELDRGDFPHDLAAGDLFEAEDEDGNTTILHVREVYQDHVLADLNHLLAGKCVTVEFEVQAIRPASRSDVRAAEMAREKRKSGNGESLVPLNRLLKGRSRR